MRLQSLIYFLLFASFSIGQQTFMNPIIPGGYPDPSICRVGDDFYIVNSSFEYFPGLPIHHSKDLVNWKLIGHGLNRENQVSGALNLIDVQENGGIHAPSIRYHEGIFYIVSTNMYDQIDPNNSNGVLQNTNFIITATNPAGPWSEPHIIEGAPGIDPDLFFDDNGKVYFIGTHSPGNVNANGIGAIWAQEIDIETWKLVGERYSLWEGACDKNHTEGPHIYKRNGVYYLLVAEGGTGHHHAVMVASSDHIFGPYVSGLRNPILTSRHLSLNNWVHSTGHADLVELKDGRWYMVALGIRNDRDGRSNMARETHLIPVIWESQIVRWEQVSIDDWQPVKVDFPVAAPRTGRVERIDQLPFTNKPQLYNTDFFDNFNNSELHKNWSFRRFPQPNTYSLSAKKGSLRLYLKPEKFSLRGRYSAMGFTQKESAFEFKTNIMFSPKQNLEEAGISIYQKDLNYINFTIQKLENNYVLKLTVQEKGEKSILPELKEKIKILANYSGQLVLKVVSKEGFYSFQFSNDNEKSYKIFHQISDNIVLGQGYTGANIGLYATSNGQKTKAYADYDWVSYIGHIK